MMGGGCGSGLDVVLGKLFGLGAALGFMFSNPYANVLG